MDNDIRQSAARKMAIEREVARQKRASKNLLLFSALCIIIWPAGYIYLWGWLKTILAIALYAFVVAVFGVSQATAVSIAFAVIGLLIGLFQVLWARSAVPEC